MTNKSTNKPQSQWYTYTGVYSKIEYYADVQEVNGQLKTETIEKVGFERFNAEAGIMEMVWVHWTNAFQWADADPCGGLGLKMVKWASGGETFASGLYFNDDKSGLAEVVVGCYGSSKMKRDKSSRDATQNHISESRKRSAVIKDDVNFRHNVNSIGNL